jgi:MFS family permease
MPDSPDIEEANPLLLESEEEYRSSLEYSRGTVDFDRNGDPENPLDWPGSYKWGVVALLSFMGFTVYVSKAPQKYLLEANISSTFTCISLAPIAGHVVDDLNGSEGAKSATVMLVTIWELGEAVGPHFIAPLSEIFGRYRLYLTMNTMFIVAILFAALSPSTELLIVSRALTGISVASNVLSPAIIGDMFVPEQRGTGLTLIMFTPLIGGTLGPIISGAVLQTLGWRAIVWISVVMASICQILFLTFFQETYKVQILRRRAARLSLEIGGFEKNKRPTVDMASLGHSIMRPAVVLLNSSVLAALLLFGSYMFSHFYIVSTTLPEILEDIYGLSPTETGLVFIANGEFAAVAL